MKRIVLSATLLLCAWIALSPAAEARPLRAEVSCTTIPAAYRAGAKAPMWVAACMTCKSTGPRRMARNANLARSDAAYVAQWYGKKYSLSAPARQFAPRVGGVAAVRTIVTAGCLTGFRARGRP